MLPSISLSDYVQMLQKNGVYKRRQIPFLESIVIYTIDGEVNSVIVVADRNTIKKGMKKFGIKTLFDTHTEPEIKKKLIEPEGHSLAGSKMVIVNTSTKDVTIAPGPDYNLALPKNNDRRFGLR